jgi:hypothetical protein
MTKKTPTGKPIEQPEPETHLKILPPLDPEEPVIAEEDPDIIPDEDPFDTPAYEAPEPGEGP